MRNVALLIQNTFRVTFRKKSNIFIYLFLPLLGVLLSILIYNGTGSEKVRIGLADRDGSRLSADFANAIKALDGYTVSTIAEEDIKENLLSGKLDAAVILPGGFGEGILSLRPVKAQIVTIKGMETTAWIQNNVNLYTRNLVDLAAASDSDTSVFDKMYAEYRANQLKLTGISLKDEHTGKLMTITSMGFLIMFVMLGASFTSQIILNEKRNRTYYRICSAPVSSREYIASNAISSMLIVALQIIAILLIMKYLFRIETFVPGTLMFLILMLFGMAAVGICLTVTAFSSSSYMASTVNTLILTPTCMLGGCFWSVDFMPEFMRKISYFTPQRWALEAIQKLQAGGSLNDIRMNLLILPAFAAASFLVAAYRFSRGENMQKFV